MRPSAGGYGTLEELLEVITWSQLGIHEKPVSAAQLLNSKTNIFNAKLDIHFLLVEFLLTSMYRIDQQVGLLNVDGYYNPLLDVFQKALEEGFLSFSARNIVVSAATASELLDKMEVGNLFTKINSSIYTYQVCHFVKFYIFSSVQNLQFHNCGYSDQLDNNLL